MKKIHIYTFLSFNVFLETCLRSFYINIVQAVHHNLVSEHALKLRCKMVRKLQARFYSGTFLWFSFLSQLIHTHRLFINMVYANFKPTK